MEERVQFESMEIINIKFLKCKMIDWKNKRNSFLRNALFMLTSLAVTVVFSLWIETYYANELENYAPKIDKELLRVLYITALITLSYVISSSSATLKIKFILLFSLNVLSVLYILEYWPNIKEIDFLGRTFNR